MNMKLARVSTMPKCHEKSTEYPLHCSAPKTKNSPEALLHYEVINF